MPRVDRWMMLTARVDPSDPNRELITEALVELGGQSVLEEETGLTTYVEPPDDPEGVLATARLLIAERLAGDPPELSWQWQPDQDWERKWRSGLRPRKISDRFVVKPSWTSWTAAPGEVVIEIDPQMAFGTGEHATTRGCLRLLDSTLRPGDSVLDVGSGSAVLSIAAAKAGAADVVAIECDPDAVLNARENVQRNDVEVVRLHEGRADADMLAGFGTHDVVVANILSGVILPLLPAFHDAIKQTGTLILSGILQAERQEIIDAAAAVGLRLSREDSEDEWWSAAFTR